ncbi:DUF4364 family protein [Clostridium sp. BJN0001]|uniref:DUF4364 family protein n=1 Tax=Clostridium sp. BJN0001 TaxID=2930219 RepID=UPI001FD0EBB8|nr:DUF4364 family protein [Clostridium sp. BJN0001]
MYENSAELAENKLLMLYVLNKLDTPISNTQFTDIMLENTFLNYFNFQQYLSELIESAFVEYISYNNKKKLLSITKKGKTVLSLFKDRISKANMDFFDKFIEDNLKIIKKELTINADYTLGKDDTFIIDLNALENGSILMEVKLTVPTKEQAISICKKWKSNPSKLYNSIFSLFIE